MNPMFWILLIMFCVLLWFILAFLFKPIGKLFYRLWEDAFNEIKETEDEEKKEGSK